VLKAIRVIKNVGRFSETVGNDLPFGRLTLVYAGNGKGKSTIAAILRSLGSGDPKSILERHRLGSDERPHVVVDLGEHAVFADDEWSKLEPKIRVFDDQFVDINVHSGLAVEPGHRKNLHTWIIGARGVELSRRLEQLVDAGKTHNSRLDRLRGQIPTAALGGMRIDEFLALTPLPEADQVVKRIEKRLAGFANRDKVARVAALEELAVPDITRSEIESLLGAGLQTVDTAALAHVAEHFSALGAGSERWVSDGIAMLGDEGLDRATTCPFCGQSLSGAALLHHYRSYFDEEYRALKTRIHDALLSHDGLLRADVVAEFERQARVAVERRGFWSQFGSLPELSLDTKPIADAWMVVHSAVDRQLRDKQNRPLDRMPLSTQTREGLEELAQRREEIRKINEQIASINTHVEVMRSQILSGDRDELELQLKTTKRQMARYSPEIVDICDAILSEQRSKADTEEKREAVRNEFLEQRKAAFDDFGLALNKYLILFNAEFRVKELTFTNPGGAPSSAYQLIVNNSNVPLAVAESDAGEVLSDFRNTLSSGDRRTLALAMYFAGTEREAGEHHLVAVIDDPTASLDAHRSLATAQAIVELAQHTEQVIVLSHSQEFMGQLFRVKRGLPCAQLQIGDRGDNSRLEGWNVAAALQEMHDLRHQRFQAFLDDGDDDLLGLAQCIRPHLEAFLNVATPADFVPGEMIGRFITKCLDRLQAENPILDAARIEELRNINEYSSQFHHQGRGIWRPPTVSPTELRGYIRRTIQFARI